MKQININKDLIPYRVRIRIAGETYLFEWHYNAEGDSFTVDLAKGEVLATGEKIVLGVPLFNAYSDERFPKAAIIPFDATQRAQRVGWNELGNNVLLYVVTEEDIDVEIIPA